MFVAPVSGQVTQRAVEVGQYVSPGQLLMTLVPLDRVYITANFKETQLAPVRLRPTRNDLCGHVWHTKV